MAATLTVDQTVTDTAVRAVLASEAASERAVIDELVDAVLAAHPEGGLVNSYRIAEEFVARRRRSGGDPDPTQTRDYVQFLFRETRHHVCRHAEDGHYRIHPEPKCSPDCDEKYVHRKARKVRPHCEFCHLELTAAGTCPMDCC